MKRRWIFSLLTASLVAGMVGTSYAEVKVSGGELRVRGVMVDNGDAATPNDGGFFEQRTRVNVEASVDENAKVFVQIQDSRKWGSETPNVLGDTTIETADNTNGGIDLSQGYVELGNLFNAPLSLRIGRQAMAYGEHRLIGSLEWSNNARRFDAIKGTFKVGDAADIDFWTAKISEPTVPGEDWGNDRNLNGIYGMLKMVPNNAIDVYLLQKIDGSIEANFYTLGARVKGDAIGIDYNAELATQFGDANATDSMDSFAYAVRAGYTIPAAMGLRVGVEIDGASGEESEEDVQKFDNLYPTNHYLYGFTDDVNWTNMQAINLNVGIKPMENLTVSAEYWIYALDQENSAGDDDNGSEINGKVNYALSKNVNLEAAYVIRDAGDISDDAATPAIEGANSYGGYGAIPADESSTFGYFQINVKFM